MGFCDLVSRLASRLLQHDVCLQSCSKITLAPPVAVTAPHIPIEVIIDILDFASLGDDHKLDNQLLNVCSLVCTEWSIVAQKLLFRHVSLRSASDFASFRRAVDCSTPRGCTLADSVVRLDCIVDVKQPQGLTHVAFAKAVTLCPNLSELTLALYGGPAQGGQTTVGGSTKPSIASFDESTLALLRSGPQITSLRFDNWSDEHGTLWQLLDAWPSLTSLSISGTHPSVPFATALPVHHAFEELRINFQTSPITDVFAALLHGSSVSLHALHFQREPSTALLTHLLDDHATSLTSLVLPSCVTPERAAALARCTSLQELRIESPGTLPSVFRTLPSTLRHLAVAVGRDSLMPCISQAVKNGRALTSITIHVGSEERPGKPELAAVRIACAVRGVELRVARDVSMRRMASHASTAFLASPPAHIESFKS